MPAYAGDGGEEPEVAGAYIIDSAGKPRRIGLAIGNEFSDHVTEKKNYLYLAPSKLRTCSIGPELILDPDFESVDGEVSIERNGITVWSKTIARRVRPAWRTAWPTSSTHHFKYPQHRRPDDAHIFFFGADAFSFGARCRTGGRRRHGHLMERLWKTVEESPPDRN